MKENDKDEDGGDVKIIIKGSDDKAPQGAGSIYAFCNHCKKDISVVYIKSENNGKELSVAESLTNKWPRSEFPENDYDKCLKDNDYGGCKKLLDGRKKRAKVKELWENFLGGCTLHGFHYCFAGNPPLRRLIWSLLLLGAFAMFFEKCTESFINFFDYPFTTTTLLVYDKRLPFPAISMCNYNDARMSKMNGTLMNEIFVASKLEGRNTSHLQSQLTGELMQRTLKEAAHRLPDMIKECSWQKHGKCSWKNFTSFKSADGDTCYTFNSGRKDPILSMSNVGEENGLRLVIDTQHSEYYYDVKNAGFKVILHDQGETPVKMQGLSVSPGFTSYMELKRTKVTNLPFPYKTMCGMPELKYFNSYSKSKCFLDKLTQYVVTLCGCRDWFMPGEGKIPVCDYETAASCMWKAWAYFEENKLDQCPVACNSVEYSAQLSYARFPANNYAKMLAKEYGLKGSDEENRRYLRDNLIEIKIYYEDLTYFDVQQVPSYDLYSLLGDVGGQIGLFLGASLLTVVEYLDLLGMVAYTSFKYRN
ncbi:acid-sensing ion channel 1B [Nematostella vectensis]|uniref:acid-sensing ion channel 1B n=1 Tax=Nematostella vectensis TaxID=45351 RepID=UPI002076F3A0|nr:acid-sensing ion channel 1B [Nematostella vectensis]